MLRRRFLFLLLVSAGAAVGCDRSAPPGSTVAPATDGAASPHRIVSLSPAITTTLVLLGERDSIVGRTPWCRGIDSTIPVIWDGSQIDAERLVSVVPTHILMQSTRRGAPADDIRAFGERPEWRVERWRLDRLSDVQEMITGLGQSLGGSVPERAAELLRELDGAASTDPAVSSLGPALLLFSADPPTAFGPGSYVDDIWKSIGGANALDAAAYPELSVEEISRLDPEWIVVVGSDRLMNAVRSWPVGAVNKGRLIQASDRGMLEPGGGVVSAIRSLRSAVAECARQGAP